MKYGPLLFELVLRDVKIKYRRSVLGVLWTILNPMLMMIILWFVFSNLFRFDIENYAIYILSGQIIFNFFQVSTTDAMMSIIGNGGLIRKVFIPKYLFVLAKILSGTVNLGASFLALLLVMLITGTKIHLVIVLCILPMFLLMIFAVGTGLFLAALAVKFRDILHLYGVFCTGLFYLTPVIYPLSILPEHVKYVVWFNPLTQILEMFRSLILEGKIPDMGNILMATGSCGLILLIGAIVFSKRQDAFILDL